MARIAKADYWFYLNEILQYRWMDPWLHGEEIIPFIDRYEADPGCLLLVPRDHGKSGSITATRLAWWLARNPFLTCVICNAAEDKANQMAKVNSKVISNNRTYQSCFTEVAPSEKWGDKGYWLNLDALTAGGFSVERIDPSIGSYGVMGNITGSHWNGGMVLDDMINREIAESPVKMRKVKQFYGEAMNTLNDYVPLVVIGTRWDYDDVYADILQDKKTGKHGALEKLVLGIKDKDGYYIWPRQTYFDMHGNRMIVGQDDETDKAHKSNVGHLYSALYWNEPTRDVDRQFDVAMVKTFLHEPPFALGRVVRVGVECDAQSVNLVDQFRQIMRKENRTFPLEAFNAPRNMDKETKIKTLLQHWINDGQCHIERSIFIADDNVGEELRTFPKGKDDCVDAFACATNLAQDSVPQAGPNVYIWMDPAFSIDDSADFTAIVAVTKCSGELYLLACDRFKTNKTDIQARRLFLMVDRYSKPGLQRRKQAPRTIGFRPSTQRETSSNMSIARYDNSFKMQPLIPK